MIELKVDRFEGGFVTFHIERQEDFNLPPEGVMCGNYLIKKQSHPEIRRIPHRIFFVRGIDKSVNRIKMTTSIQEYLMLIESINIFKKDYEEYLERKKK